MVQTTNLSAEERTLYAIMGAASSRLLELQTRRRERRKNAVNTGKQDAAGLAEAAEARSGS